MIVTENVAAPPAVMPDPPVCAVGRWITHPHWPGWRDPCGEPGRYAHQPPYVICWWHL